MKEIINSEPFILALTLGTYYIGVLINNRVKRAITNPLLIATPLIVIAMMVLDIDYPTYEKGSHMISFLLGPSVVALGYALHKQISHIKGNVLSILSALVVGSIVSVVVVAGICKLGGCDAQLTSSLAPKSVTIPIALGITARSNGILAVTTIAVFVTGILGSIIGPWWLTKVGVKSRVARGLAMGAAAHGVGTARAIQIGQLEGAVSGMAIGLMGVATAVVVPILEQLWQ